MDNYIEILILGTDDEQHIGMNKAMKALHSFIKSGSSLGLAFPDYQDEGRFCRLGRRIRVFQDRASLEALKAYPMMINLEATGRTFITAVHSTPEVKEYRLYQRSRQHERYYGKTQSKRFAALVNNKQQQGIEFSETEQETLWKAQTRKNKTRLPYIITHSLSTGQDYSIHIKQTRVTRPEAPQAAFNGYGLASNDDAALPHF